MDGPGDGIADERLGVASVSAVVISRWRGLTWTSRGALAVAAWFILVDGFLVGRSVHFPASLGVDARVYASAASVWLAGGDPWSAGDQGVLFAAPPPTLLFGAALIPLGGLAGLVVGLLDIGAAVLVARKLGLPGWAAAFPPFVEAALVGNPDALIVAALLLGWTPLAVIAKIYAFVPPIILGAWRQVAFSVFAIVVTAPFLPWDRYIASFGSISGTLQDQASGYSAWGHWPLAVAVVCLALMPRRNSAWLTVPAVWPASQFHYNAIGLPGASPLAAAFLAIPFSLGGPVLAAVVTVLETRLLRTPDEAARSGIEPDRASASQGSG